MTTAIDTELRALKRGEPGRRFQDRYEQSRRKKAGRTITGRVVRLVIAATALAIAVVLVFIPGPAVLFFLIAGGLLATESRTIARVLDWMEIQLWNVFRWTRRRWNAFSRIGKIVVVVALGATSLAAAYFMWRLMFR